MTRQEALRRARELLGRRNDLVERGTVETEAEQIVRIAVGRAEGRRLDRLELFSKMSEAVPEKAAAQVVEWASARAAGRVLQHLTGVQVFLDHEYEVGPEVLIPRPETEMLVEVATEGLRSRPELADFGLEVGLGSGILSIELLSRFPRLRMRASELSAGARATASKNATQILSEGASRLEVVPATHALDVLEPLFGGSQAGFLISNPPYLTHEDGIEDEVRSQEPASALFAPESDPLHFYRQIARRGREVLRAGGFAFLELAHERAAATLKLFESSGWSAKISLDLNGRPRVLTAIL